MKLRCQEQLVGQHYIEQRPMELQSAIVVNKTQFSEPVHEEADPRAGCANHLRQHLLTDLGDYRLGYPFLSKMCEQQKDPRQSLFARIEKLINQVFFVTDIPRQQISHEQVGEFMFPMKRFHHG